MEVGIPPGQQPPSPNQYREIGSPTSNDIYRTWNSVSNTIAAQQRATSPVEASGWSTESSSQISPRSSYRQDEPLQPRTRSPVSPQMRSASSRKVQQLTGHDLDSPLQPRSQIPVFQSRKASSRKVQQLTGHDLGHEKGFPENYKQNVIKLYLLQQVQTVKVVYIVNPNRVEEVFKTNYHQMQNSDPRHYQDYSKTLRLAQKISSCYNKS